MSKINIVKIRVFLPLITGTIMIRDQDGSFIGSPEFTEMLYEADQKFREPIITFINDEIGIHGWAIRFYQFDEIGMWFDAKIFAQNQEDAMKMIPIIKEKMPNMQFNWIYGGDTSNIGR